jgi:hypothetical protein
MRNEGLGPAQQLWEPKLVLPPHPTNTGFTDSIGIATGLARGESARQWDRDKHKYSQHMPVPS